ncbi:MAG: hypothetical protein K0R06_1673 [Clostridium sp.]|jgi:hypothetical protein|nr:hypothetical protein [Clostridium sp.]
MKINSKSKRCDGYFEVYKETGSEDSELSEGSVDAVGLKIG